MLTGRKREEIGSAVAISHDRRLTRNKRTAHLHAFYVDSRAHEFLHEQQSLAVAACYGTADLHVLSVGLF